MNCLRRSVKIVLYCSILFFVHSLRAQDGYEHFSLPAMSAGGEYTVLSQGIEAIGLNPALLGTQPERRFQISIFPISGYGIQAGPTFRDASDISTIFGKQNGFVNDTVRQKVLSLLSNDKLSGRADAEVFAAYYFVPNVGGFGLSWTTHAAVHTSFPQNFLDYFYNAETSLLQDTVGASGFQMQAMWYNEYALSFGKEVISYPSTDSTEAFLGSLNVGGAIKYVAGIGYAGLEPGNYVNVPYSNNATTINVNYAMQFAYPDAFNPTNIPNRFSFSFLSSETAGSGIGADIGVSAKLWRASDGSEALHVGLSLTDIGSITWNKNAVERSADNASKTIVHNPGQTSLNNVDSLLSPLAGKLSSVGSFTIPLPTIFRLGAALDLDAMGISPSGTSMMLAAEFADGLTNTVGSPQGGRFGFGLMINHPANIVSYRAGIGFIMQSGSSGMSFGIGTTLFDRVALDLATTNLTQLLGSTGSIDIAFSLRVLL